MGKFKDLTGQKFNRLTVLELHHKKQRYDKKGIKNGFTYYYLCLCDCGNTKIVSKNSLITSRVQSCGCLAKETKSKIHLIHGKGKTKLYKIWKGIKQRCLNPNCPAYKSYGGRGITMYQEWQNDFMSFYDWAINNGYNDNLSIDRIDNNKGYSPNNCRWANSKIQNNNKRNNIKIIVNNETKTLVDLSKELQINYFTLYQRHRKGQNILKRKRGK